MSFPNESFDETVVFFLLHEQPEDARRKTVAEAIRVTRAGWQGYLCRLPWAKPFQPHALRDETYTDACWSHLQWTSGVRNCPHLCQRRSSRIRLHPIFTLVVLYQKVVLSL